MPTAINQNLISNSDADADARVEAEAEAEAEKIELKSGQGKLAKENVINHKTITGLGRNETRKATKPGPKQRRRQKSTSQVRDPDGESQRRPSPLSRGADPLRS